MNHNTSTCCSKIECSIKPRMLYDGTVLKNMFSTKNSDRTGVYFVVVNVLVHFLKKSDFFVDIYCKKENRNDVENALEAMNLGYLNLVTDKDIDLSKYDLFFSPFSPAPNIIQRSNINNYLILYDMTPIILGDIEAPNEKWYNELQDSFKGYCNYIAISECTKKDFISHYTILEKRNIIHSYISTNQNFSYRNDQKKFSSIREKYHLPEKYVLSLCTLQPRKNLIHLIDCFIEFISGNNIDDLYLVLCGGHWDIFIGEINKKITQYPELKRYIIITGYIEDDDLQEIYSNALFFVYVSLYEGFGMPVLEAMKCGCPVITSDVSSMPEVIGDAGIKVDPYDPVQLINGFELFYNDAEYRIKCKYDGIERAKLFTWDNFINDVTRFIYETKNSERKISIFLKLKYRFKSIIYFIKKKSPIYIKKTTYLKMIYAKIPIFCIPQAKYICRKCYRAIIKLIVNISSKKNKLIMHKLYDKKMKNQILINMLNEVKIGKCDLKSELMKIQNTVKELGSKK